MEAVCQSWKPLQIQLLPWGLEPSQMLTLHNSASGSAQEHGIDTWAASLL